MSLKLLAREIIQRMFQWNAIDTGPNLAGQNVLEIFELATRHNRRMIRTELERVFCQWIYFHLRSKIYFCPCYVGDRPHHPPWIPHVL